MNQEQPRPRTKENARKMTGLVIVVVVILAAVSLMIGMNQELFGPKDEQIQADDGAVKMAVDTPVPDEAGDAARPVDDGANSTALNAPVPVEVAVVEVEEVPVEPVPPASELGGAAPETPAPQAAPMPAKPEPVAAPVAAPVAIGGQPAVQEAPAQEPETLNEVRGAKKYIGRVEGLNFESDFSTFKMTVKTSRPVEEVTWFPVKNPRKVAIDLRGAWRPRIKPLYKFDEGIVEKVIVGEHPDRLRIVLWLKTPKGKPVAEPKIVKTSGGLEITVKD